jgi:hypothetical protein
MKAYGFFICSRGLAWDRKVCNGPKPHGRENGTRIALRVYKKMARRVGKKEITDQLKDIDFETIAS